jgi:hypothetical protein
MFIMNQRSLAIRVGLILTLLGGFFRIEPVRPVLASAITVTNTSDSGAGSLRQAIADAVSGDIITFDPSLSGGVIGLGSPLVIDKDLTIDGTNLAAQVRLHGGADSSIQIQNCAVTISGLTISGAYSNGDGGAIWSNGDLKLISSTIRDNRAEGNGGGIFSSGSLLLQNVALYHNESGQNGAGIFAETPGDEILIANTTISENYADADGGGIYLAGHSIVKLFNSTVVQNGYITNEIVSRDTSELMLYNSIVACYFKDSCTDLYQSPLILNSILGLPGEDYGLEGLADNGGPTETIAIRPSSPLVDAGDDTICANSEVNNVDQRGVMRPYGSRCDIGAFEVEYLTVSGNVGIGEAALKYGYGLFTSADNNGDYVVKVLPGWSGTVIPVKAGYTFDVVKKDYSNLQSDQTDQNYIATINTYTPSGNVGDTWRVSVTGNDIQADDDTYDPAISADGRYVVYWSFASNLVPGDGATDVVVHDNQTGETSAISVDSNGIPLSCNAYRPSISADGRYVAFESCTASLWLVYLYDRYTGILEDVARGTVSSISANGRYIVYMSTDNSDNQPRIFVQDTWLKADEQVSISTTGGKPNGDSIFSSISADGDHIAFQSKASNLVASDTNGAQDIFVRNIQTDETVRVSVNSNNVQANGDSFLPSISWDGRFVTFYSSATNLVANDTNGVMDVFVHDLQSGETTLVSLGSNGKKANGPSDRAHISGDGRFIAFRSFATNLIANDTNGVADIFLYDRETGVTKRVSVSDLGAQANGASPSAYSSDFALSGDGKYLAFSSDATNLINDDTNGRSDAFVRDLTSDVPIFSFTSNPTQDGWILESSETSNNGSILNKTAITLRLGDDASNKQYRSILSFDTPTLPEGAIITSVTLKFKHAGISGTNPFNTHGKLLVDICKGAFKGNSLLQLGDFNAKCPLDMYKSQALIYTNTKADNWYSKPLLSDYFRYINLGGVTQFRLRFTRDDNNNFGADFLKLYSGDAAEADRPQLIIEYYIP